MFYTYAHLDLRLWHFSPWIRALTLQYMQCIYATSFILPKAPHMPLEVGSEGSMKIYLGEETYTI
jgi:hypothetical protein